MFRWSRDGYFFGQVGGRGSFSTNWKSLSNLLKLLLVSQVHFIQSRNGIKEREEAERQEKQVSIEIKLKRQIQTRLIGLCLNLFLPRLLSSPAKVFWTP